MYRITVKLDGLEYPLHEPYDEELRAINPVLIVGIDIAGSLEFELPATHPYIDKLRPLEAEFYVYDDNMQMFCGRTVRPVRNFYNTVAVTCEGEYAYLVDSRQRPYEHTGTIREFLDQILQVHNSQVEERKHFHLGIVTVADDNNEAVRSETECLTTLQTFQQKLQDVHGGHLRIRHQDGKRFFDYVHDYGGTNNQVIRFGENILDLNRYQDATKIFTCLIPAGADVEYKDNNGETQTRQIDITSVNGGLDYVEHPEGIARYGRIWGSHRWDDITDPETLLAKANAYLEESVSMPETLEITAVDLSLIDVDIDRLWLGYWTTVESIPHGISKQFILSKRKLCLDDPGKDRILLGQTLTSFTGKTVNEQAKISARVDKVAENASKEINRKVENATNLITGGLGGYVVLDNIDPNTGEKMHPWRILIMNTPDKDTAKNVIQFNQNGIGFSTTGINGPYANAWTIDGNLIADFITAGTMLADRIRGGTMELGGSGIARDGMITVKDVNDRVIGYWDKTGLHIFKGVLNGPDIIGGTIDIGNGLFIVDSQSVYFGDYYVSADGSNVFRASDGSVVLQTAAGGPLGSYTSLKLSSGSGETELSDHHIRTGSAEIRRIWGSCKLINGDGVTNWWEGYSLYEALDFLYNKISNLKN